MEKKINLKCPLCQTQMIVRDYPQRGKPFEPKSFLFCGTCGYGLKAAYKARLDQAAHSTQSI